MAARRFHADEFVDAALALLARDVTSSLTLKAVGEAMGANTTAVYRHFPNKEALLVAMIDRLLGALLEPAVELDDPRADLERIAAGMRSVLQVHPILAATVVGTEILAPSTIRLSRRVIEDLSALGLRGANLVRTYQTLENLVLGATVVDGDGSPRAWEIRRQRYLMLGHPDFIAVAKSVEEVQHQSETAFREGVSSLLDTAVRAAANDTP